MSIIMDMTWQFDLISIGYRTRPFIYFWSQRNLQKNVLLLYNILGLLRYVHPISKQIVFLKTFLRSKMTFNCLHTIIWYFKTDGVLEKDFFLEKTTSAMNLLIWKLKPEPFVTKLWLNKLIVYVNALTSISSKQQLSHI